MVTETKLSQAQRQLEAAYKAVYDLREIREIVEDEHTEKTPHRTAFALFEMFAGVWQDPVNVLNALFDAKRAKEMVYVNDVSFVSMCAHHTLPFFGKAHFGYVPNEKLVGTSKIPRLIDCYARRPQIQEFLAASIVDTFMEVVKPYGCGVVIEAWHFCVSIRGVNQRPAYMKTNALRGSFQEDPTRTEFLNGIRKTTEQLWP
jgi:GTP cyclohydrolase IA